MTPRVGVAQRRRTIIDEAGQVTAFVVVVVVALLFAAGLVLDGGTILSAKRQAMYDSEQAARAGAQGLRVEDVRAGASGSAAADPDRARDQAVSYLNRIGRSDYSISVSDDSVTVTVRIERELRILPGGPKTMVGTSTARAVRGVGAPET